ncbi:lipoxygenase homology domain-containing protein 1-like [Oncorhynchus keta]|uniref:lipoxygenase homology domain-containing protein 1-like n=1 Tax=Oncorhynchus keta TaxID=8018 RepID=UPI0015F8D7AE|nr:lipoxygenase homology domain-containing protein 1-like [Oncorhynchus keta]XP_052335083.1 lipoxygenase homology domain-containing protein 1-like [Oncorhynchus keta]
MIHCVVRTGDTCEGVADRKVFLTIYGDLGETGMQTQQVRATAKAPPQRAAGWWMSCRLSCRQKASSTSSSVSAGWPRTEAMVSSQTVQHTRHQHHPEGPAPGWHLEYINVIDETMGQNFRFPCDPWLAKHVDDGPIMRELACANNYILVFSDKTNELTSDPDVGW